MSACTYFIGCTHFGHEAMYRFVRANGEKVRPYSCAEEGDAVMVANWNNTVRKGDKVYVLGDVAFHKDHLKILHSLNGSKVLIKGNHDTLTLPQYEKYFRDVRATHRLDNEILSHIPIHPGSLWRGKRKCWMTNIHAHLHAEVVNRVDGQDGEDGIEPDARYFSVCVERINYTPISLEEIRKRVLQ